MPTRSPLLLHNQSTPHSDLQPQQMRMQTRARIQKHIHMQLIHKQVHTNRMHLYRFADTSISVCAHMHIIWYLDACIYASMYILYALRYPAAYLMAIGLHVEGVRAESSIVDGFGVSFSTPWASIWKVLGRIWEVLRLSLDALGAIWLPIKSKRLQKKNHLEF